MQIYLNGEPETLSQAMSLWQLLESKNMQEKRLAVEVNGSIIPRSQFSDHFFQDQDKVEIISAVGGG